jgi:hypothetical protein
MSWYGRLGHVAVIGILFFTETRAGCPCLEFGTSLWVMLVLVLVLETTLRSKGTPTVPTQFDHEKLDVLVDRFPPSSQIREFLVSYRIEDEDEDDRNPVVNNG